MASSPQENASGKKESTRFLELQPLTTAWHTLTSPWTLGVTTLLLATLLVTASLVPQGVGGRLLLEHVSFSEGRVIEGLGVQDVWTAWPTIILGMIAVLSLTGLLLRRLPSFGGDLDEVGEHAPFLTVAETHTDKGIGETLESLKAAGLKGEPSQPTADGTVTISSFNLCGQGRWLVAAGLAVCGISLVIDQDGASRFEVQQIPSRPEIEPASRTLEDGQWVDSKVDFTFRCTAADPVDETQRKRTCIFQSGGQTYKFPLTQGEAVRAGEHRIEFEEEKPIPSREITDRAGNRTGRIPVRLVLAGEPPKLVSGESGTWLRLADGREVRLIAGVDGPVVVVRKDGSLPVLLAPQASFKGSNPETYPHIKAVPDWSVTTRLSTEPGRLLRYGSWLLIAFGLFLIVALRHLKVVLVPSEGGGTRVRCTSLNRSRAPHALMEHLDRRLKS